MLSLKAWFVIFALNGLILGTLIALLWLGFSGAVGNLLRVVAGL